MHTMIFMLAYIVQSLGDWNSNVSRQKSRRSTDYGPLFPA